MNSLEQFCEPIKVADDPIGNEYKAYKMDSSDKKNDMRAMVGLGTCHCCDYFKLKDDSIIFIEETRLLKKVNNIRKEYDYLKDEDKDKIVNNLIPARMQLKTYGAMLLLCRLAGKYSDVKDSIKNKKYRFWLIASSISSDEEKKFFDSLKDSLRGVLTGVIGKALLDDVEVFSSDILKKKLSE